VLTLPALLSAALGVRDLTRPPREQWSGRADAEAAVDAMPPAPPGRIAVLGDPLVLRLAHRAHALSVTGWSTEQWDDELWRRAADELGAAAPPLVFVDDEAMALVEERGELLERILEESYEVASRTADGTWFEAR
jgi:hypothetical protein